MADARDSVSNQATRLFDNILKSYQCKEVLDVLIKHFHDMPNSKGQLKCLEVVNFVFNG